MKAQAMIDSLMLVLVFSFILVLFAISYNSSSFNNERIRYEALQHKKTLDALLGKTIIMTDENGTQIVKATAREVMAWAECSEDHSFKGVSAKAELLKQLNDTLKLINNNKHYILSINMSAYGGEVRLYDNKSSVCLEDVVVARESFKACGKEVKLLYGTWFKWMNPPDTC